MMRVLSYTLRQTMLRTCEKANKILSDEASVDYPSKYAPNVVHRDYMVVECEEWEGG